MSLSNFRLASLRDKIEAEVKALEDAKTSKPEDTKDKPVKGKTVDKKTKTNKK